MMPDFSKMMQMMTGGKQASFDDSEFQWTEEARKRLERVPAGFMRNMTIKRVEDYAKGKNLSVITLEVAEAGLSESKSMMSSFMGNSNDDEPTDPNAVDLDEKPEKSEPFGSELPYYYCEMCGYTVKGYVPDECPICMAAKEKFRPITAENRSIYLTETSGKVMRWDKDALLRLERIPEGFMRDMTKWRIEMAARKANVLNITQQVMDDKYEYWSEGSKNIPTELVWEKDALERISRIPEFVRGMVQKEVERYARSQGTDTVTAEILSQVRGKWESGEEFHSDLGAQGS